MFVYENYHAAVKWLWAETFRDNENRLVDETVSQSKPEKSGFV